MSLHPKAKQCTHIKVTGHRCGSPALRGEHFCYFHTRMLKGVRNRPDQRLAAAYYVVDSPEALQVALMETISNIVRGDLDPRRASLVLRALNIAQKNMRYARFHHNPKQMVRDIPDYGKQFLEEYEAEEQRLAELRKANTDEPVRDESASEGGKPASTNETIASSALPPDRGEIAHSQEPAKADITGSKKP